MTPSTPKEPTHMHLVQIWKEKATSRDITNSEFDRKLVIPIVIGCTPDQLPYFMLLTSKEPQYRRNLQAIKVSAGRRNEIPREQWSLTFTLLDWGLIHAFSEICSALIERISETTSEESALSEVYTTLDQWRRLLKTTQHSDDLKQLQGTTAELIAALRISEKTSSSLTEVLRYWAGPYGGVKDFSFPASKLSFEIKSVRPLARMVDISSSDQLSTGSEEALELITVQMDPSSAPSEQSISLPQVVSLIRKSTEPTELSETNDYIEDGLRNVGIDLYSDFVISTAFQLGPMNCYQVTDQFPRIIDTQVPIGVDSITYKINLMAIQDFMVKSFDFAIEQKLWEARNK